MMPDCESKLFDVAEHVFRIVFKDNSRNNMRLLPSFRPFVVEEKEDCKLLFSLLVDDALQPIDKEHCRLIRDFDTGNGHTQVEQLPNGGYQYLIRNISGNTCCLLQTNKEFTQCQCGLHGNYNMRTFGLNNALMLIYAFAGSFWQTVLIHASLVRCDGWGYPFIAKSGTGKSTQVANWLKNIPGCDLMNDDNPVIRLIDDTPYIYGSPWSGKTPCYRNIKAPLGAITRIERAQENWVVRLQTMQAFASILPSCSSMKWDSDIYQRICALMGRIVETTPIYTLHCLPNPESALICHKTIQRQKR